MGKENQERAVSWKMRKRENLGGKRTNKTCYTEPKDQISVGLRSIYWNHKERSLAREVLVVGGWGEMQEIQNCVRGE